MPSADAFTYLVSCSKFGQKATADAVASTRLLVTLDLSHASSWLSAAVIEQQLLYVKPKGWVRMCIRLYTGILPGEQYGRTATRSSM